MIRRLLDSPYLYFGLAVLIVLGWFVSQIEIKPPALAEKPIEAVREIAGRDDVNLVFILIDTMRADRLSSYGYERDTTPVMDRLAEVGIRFSNNIAQSSWTKTSMASLWTSTYPSRNGIVRYPHGIPEETELPAEILQRAGFRVAGLFRNGWLEPNFGFAQGFDSYFMPGVNRAFRDVKHRQLSHRIGGTDLDATEAAKEFLRSYKSERFFLYLHYMDLHQYTFSNEFSRFGTEYSDYYDNALAWSDANVGMVIQELIKNEILDRTVIVIASDHGEEFLEHGGEGHGKSLFREVVHTPFIMTLPFRIRGGGLVIDDLVANIDIWPTLLDLFGLPPMEAAQGRSLLPRILGEPLEPRPVFSQLDRRWGTVDAPSVPFVAITTDKWRAVHYVDDPKRDRLYDSQNDYGDQHDLKDEKPEIVAELVQRIDRYLAVDVEAPQPIEYELDDLRLGQLRALGYAVGNRRFVQDKQEAIAAAKKGEDGAE